MNDNCKIVFQCRIQSHCDVNNQFTSPLITSGLSKLLIQKPHWHTESTEWGECLHHFTRAPYNYKERSWTVLLACLLVPLSFLCLPPLPLCLRSLPCSLPCLVYYYALLFICLTPSVCMALYRKHNVGQTPVLKSSSFDIRQRKTTGRRDWGTGKRYKGKMCSRSEIRPSPRCETPPGRRHLEAEFETGKQVHIGIFGKRWFRA